MGPYSTCRLESDGVECNQQHSVARRNTLYIEYAFLAEGNFAHKVSLETATRGSRSLPWQVKPKHSAAIIEEPFFLQNARLPCDLTSIDAALCVHAEGFSRQGTCRFSDHTCWLRWIVTKPEAMAYFQQGEAAACWLLWATVSLIRLDEDKSWRNYSNYTCTTFAACWSDNTNLYISKYTIWVYKMRRFPSAAAIFLRSSWCLCVSI